MSKRTDSANRRIICIGSPAAVITGQQLVHNAALQLCDVSGVDKDQLSNMTAIFWIPTESSGAIIGKAGATLGQIREESLVKVDFAKEEVKSMRPCSITGPLQNIIHAETFIFNVLANARTTQMNGGGKRTMEGPSDGSKRMRLGDQGGGEQTKLLIPARNAGAVIGKQGSGLGRIREECGVKVDMQQQAQAPQWPEDRVLILQGPSANRTAAITSVLQATMQGGTETDCELKMLVSRAEAGAIIGKQGSTLKHIRETTGISTQVEQNEVMGERLVRCSGAPLSVMNVVRLIMDVLAQGSQGGGNGGASMMGPIMPFA